jgi:hypothetical protein
MAECFCVRFLKSSIDFFRVICYNKTVIRGRRILVPVAYLTPDTCVSEAGAVRTAARTFYSDHQTIKRAAPQQPSEPFFFINFGGNQWIKQKI